MYILLVEIQQFWLAHSIAGELCKLASVMGAEFPLSRWTLPASDWPVRSGMEDSACLVFAPCAEKGWSAPLYPLSLYAEKCVALPFVKKTCAAEHKH